MKPRILSRGWFALLLLIVPAIPGPAAPFAADLVDTRAGQTTTGTLHYQDKSYRFELGGPGQQLIVMVDGSSGVTRLLNPSEKSYLEAGPTEPMSLFANPFALYAQFAKKKEVRTEGTEAVDGVPCQKRVVSSGEQVFVTGWVSEEFDLPLKIQTQLDGRVIELRNIRRGPQDPALFSLPARYQLTVVKEEPEPQPEWAGRVPRAPLLGVPFERTLPEGGIVRLRPRAGRWIEIAGTNVGSVQGTFTAAPFKGGKYTGGGSMSSVILDPGDAGAMKVGARPATTDELVLHVGPGTMKLKVTYVAPPPPRPGEAPETPDPAMTEPAAEATAELAAPAAADMAARLEVTWTGPGNQDDFIAVARAAQPPGTFDNRVFVRSGNPAKVWVPSEPGEYELRYILGRGIKLLAKAPLTVNAVTAEVRPPAAATAGMEFEVIWQGPGHAGDFIAVARPNQPPGASVSSVRIKPGGTLKVRAPREPGTYEVRYILGRGSKVLAKAIITITTP
ncbi:MAG TPA: hypothetical protein VL200_14430 [Lacunisphaera sp.]|jgi:hypothetical protein|nr:hypothetical protein [Lacunisphaera sp.]